MPIAILFLGKKSISSQHCINFTNELASSLDLFGIGFLAQYLPHLAAFTSSLLVFLFFIKAFAKPKRLLAIISIPITYFAAFKIFIFLIEEVFSYCYF